MVPRECYLRISLHSQSEGEDTSPQTSLRATGFLSIFSNKGAVNKQYTYIPLAMDRADFPCEYLMLNYTEGNLMLLEIQLQNIPKDSWDSMHQELSLIPEECGITNSSINSSIESEYCTLGSSFNTLGSELTTLVFTSYRSLFVYAQVM